jgi:hypothetical protein
LSHQTVGRDLGDLSAMNKSKSHHSAMGITITSVFALLSTIETARRTATKLACLAVALTPF